MKSWKWNNAIKNTVCGLLLCLAVVVEENAFGEMPRPSALANGSQYELVPWTAGWHAAKADAEARGGHLATITSEAEWAEICRLFTPGELAGTWLGASDEQSEGNWEWVTGEPLVFARWSAGEPDNAGDSEHFLGVRNSEISSWNDFPDNYWYMTKYLLEYEDGCAPTAQDAPNRTLDVSLRRRQNVLIFKTGRRIDCTILTYSNGMFEVQLENGDVRQAPV